VMRPSHRSTKATAPSAIEAQEALVP